MVGLPARPSPSEDECGGRRRKHGEDSHAPLRWHRGSARCRDGRTDGRRRPAELTLACCPTRVWRGWLRSPGDFSEHHTHAARSLTGLSTQTCAFCESSLSAQTRLSRFQPLQLRAHAGARTRVKADDEKYKLKEKSHVNIVACKYLTGKMRAEGEMESDLGLRLG